MKAAVLHVNSASPASRSPTMRIASFVASELGIPLVHDPVSAKKHRGKRLDVLFLKLGVLKFSQHREEAIELVQNARLVINLENDCLFKPDPRLVREKDYMTWSTVEQRHQYVNWNKLTWLPTTAWRRPLPLVAPAYQGLFYYGAFKDVRKASFDKYLNTKRYPIHVSTYRGQRKFIEAYGSELHFVPPIRDPRSIAQYEATVYIEDDYSHTLYSSPGNRFYECLQQGIAQLFDIDTLNTMARAGYKVPPALVVNSAAEVHALLRHAPAIRAWQRNNWHRDYGKELVHELRAACRSTFGAKYAFT